jgi:heme exporter protein D
MSETGMQAFFDMGGYGVFIWPAYGLTALVLAALAGASLRGLRRSQAALDALERNAGMARRSPR